VLCPQEFIVAGSQRLTDLRDALVCPADVNLQALGMAVPSAYFYIEGTFYSDLRAPGSLDYSEPVIEFCQQNSLLPPAPEGADAEARQRGDLNLEGRKSRFFSISSAFVVNNLIAIVGFLQLLIRNVDGLRRLEQAPFRSCPCVICMAGHSLLCWKVREEKQGYPQYNICFIFENFLTVGSACRESGRQAAGVLSEGRHA
jgi:hypothetical protein